LRVESLVTLSLHYVQELVYLWCFHLFQCDDWTA